VVWIREEWAAQIASLGLHFVSEFGNGTAILENLVCGGFHFTERSTSEKRDKSWKNTDWLPSLGATLVVDRTGELSHRLRTVVGLLLDRHTPKQIRPICHQFINWFLFGSTLLMRGELARDLDLLSIVQRRLLQMVRVSERSTRHRSSPPKALDYDISEASCARYVACTTDLDEGRSGVPTFRAGPGIKI
jgi:Lincosamide nucleotidyltransferase-like, C-terminal domain